MSDADLEVVSRLFAPLTGVDLVELFDQDESVAALEGRAAGLLDPAADVAFFAADGEGLEGLRGFGGLRDGWREWLSPFSEYRIELDKVTTEGGRVAVLVRQTGRTRHGGVEVQSSPSAAVFALIEGRIVRAAFYLDRVHAGRSEGLDLSG